MCRQIDDGSGEVLQTERINRKIGHMPIMVRSQLCHLANMSPQKLGEQHEEFQETGGYFIVNGLEKLIRLLIVPR